MDAQGMGVVVPGRRWIIWQACRKGIRCPVRSGVACCLVSEISAR